MKFTLTAVLALSLAATVLHADVKQYTVACDAVSVSNDVPVIYIKGRPMHVKAASPEILASLKKLAAKAKSGQKNCRAVIAIEDGVVRGVAQ